MVLGYIKLYYTYNKEPPPQKKKEKKKIVLGNYLGPYVHYTIIIIRNSQNGKYLGFYIKVRPRGFIQTPQKRAGFARLRPVTRNAVPQRSLDANPHHTTKTALSPEPF